jgi:lytic murein transglycosylase
MSKSSSEPKGGVVGAWSSAVRLGLATIALGGMMGAAVAAPCGDDASGFAEWRQSFALEAAANGVGDKALAALKSTNYAAATIRADRGLKSFKLSLKEFMVKRGSTTIIARGRKLKAANAALFAQIEQRYGVPAGPLIAIWGMESGFGGTVGNQNTLSAVATLAYDCRRPEFFTDQLYAALQLIDRGMLSPQAKGAMHGEVGQTQFLPKNVLKYGVDGDGDGALNLNGKIDALVSTANFLKGHGWKPGLGYQPGEANFVAIQGWNAATVYQQAIAIMGAKIDS